MPAIISSAINKQRFLVMKAQRNKRTRFIFCLLFAVLVLIRVGFILADNYKQEQDVETICKLFNVPRESISVPSVKIIIGHTGEELSSFELPYQDADLYAVGCFRLPSQTLSEVKGTAHTPADYQQYTRETVKDWTRDDTFKASILKLQIEGDVLFSPETGWVYFNLDI